MDELSVRRKRIGLECGKSGRRKSSKKGRKRKQQQPLEDEGFLAIRFIIVLSMPILLLGCVLMLLFR